MEQFGITIPMLVWGCIGFTIIVAFGCSVWKKLTALNHKHGIIRWSDYEVEIVFVDTEDSPTDPHEDSLALGSMSGWESLDSVSMTYYE